MPSVLITGAAGGIGEALCRVFHNNGYLVVGVDKKKVTEDTPYEVLRFDIADLCNDPAGSEEFFRSVDSITGGELDVLINNAAVQVVKKIKDIDKSDWKSTLDVNLLAPFWLIQHFEASLRKNRGNVVNIASIHSQLTKAEFSVYATSKGALVALTRSLSLEMAPDVRINAVVPAATDTPMLRAGFEGNLEKMAELGKYHPLGRIANAEEVAKTALFLAGEGASFMTGAVLHVDGGIGGVLHDPIVAR